MTANTAFLYHQCPATDAAHYLLAWSSLAAVTDIRRDVFYAGATCTRVEFRYDQADPAQRWLWANLKDLSFGDEVRIDISTNSPLEDSDRAALAEAVRIVLVDKVDDATVNPEQVA